MGKKVKIVRMIDVTEMGRAGGKATAANRTADERSDAGKKAVTARWDAYYQAHPEKLKQRQERQARKIAKAAKG